MAVGHMEVEEGGNMVMEAGKMMMEVDQMKAGGKMMVEMGKISVVAVVVLRLSAAVIAMSRIANRFHNYFYLLLIILK